MLFYIPCAFYGLLADICVLTVGCVFFFKISSKSKKN